MTTILLTNLVAPGALIEFNIPNSTINIPVSDNLRKAIRETLISDLVTEACETMGIDKSVLLCGDKTDDPVDIIPDPVDTGPDPMTDDPDPVDPGFPLEPLPDDLMHGLGPIEEGANLSFHEPFLGVSVADGQGDFGLERPKWIDSFSKWKVRHLEGNNDIGVKKHFDGVTHINTNEGLLLRAMPKDIVYKVENWDYAAGMISTEKSFAQEFGIWEIDFECRGIGKGHQFSAWLVPQDGSWPPEIDIFELAADDQHVYLNLHMKDKTGLPKQKKVALDTTKPTTIGVIWTPDGITWMAKQEGTTWSVVHQVKREVRGKMHLNLSWEVGTDWVKRPDEETPWPASILLTDVRVASYDDLTREILLID